VSEQYEQERAVEAGFVDAGPAADQQMAETCAILGQVLGVVVVGSPIPGSSLVVASALGFCCPDRVTSWLGQKGRDAKIGIRRHLVPRIFGQAEALERERLARETAPNAAQVDPEEQARADNLAVYDELVAELNSLQPDELGLRDRKVAFRMIAEPGYVPARMKIDEHELVVDETPQRSPFLDDDIFGLDGGALAIARGREVSADSTGPGAKWGAVRKIEAREDAKTEEEVKKLVIAMEKERPYVLFPRLVRSYRDETRLSEDDRKAFLEKMVELKTAFPWLPPVEDETLPTTPVEGQSKTVRELLTDISEEDRARLDKVQEDIDDMGVEAARAHYNHDRNTPGLYEQTCSTIGHYSKRMITGITKVTDRMATSWQTLEDLRTRVLHLEGRTRPVADGLRTHHM
jgi:hypothetical protein